MPTYPVITMVGDEPTFAVPMGEILKGLEQGGAIKILSPLEFITEQQRKWWKGVILPALSADSGDTIAYWEAKLKLAVLPDDFKPETVKVGDDTMTIIPSITKLSKKKMNLLIEGSVAQCHEWGFSWITLPESSLRK